MYPVALIVGHTSFCDAYKKMCKFFIYACVLSYNISIYACISVYEHTPITTEKFLKSLIEPHIRDLCKYLLTTSLKANQDSNSDCKPTSHKNSFIHGLVDMTCDWYNVSTSENDCFKVATHCWK